MTAILDNDDSLDLDELAAGLKQALPPYARPLFVRSVKEMDMTGEFVALFWSNLFPLTNLLRLYIFSSFSSNQKI